MQSYHFRLTAKWSDAEKTIIDFVRKYKPTTYVFSEEVSKQDVIHLHGHLEYEAAPAKSTLSDFFKKHGFSGKYYHKQCEKDKQNNLLYVCKDLDIKFHNLEEAYYNDILDKTQQINDDKKRETRHKLFDLYFKWYEENIAQCSTVEKCEITLTEKTYYDTPTEFGPYICEIENIALFINDLYVNEWDKEPPLAHLSGYVLFIATKMNKQLDMEFYDIRKFYMKRFM